MHIVLEDFQQGRRWEAFSERAAASVDILPAPERSQNALRLKYDFRAETTEGGSRRAYCRPDTLTIPAGAYPTHLGIWLYGDGSGAWTNGCVVDANGTAEEIAYGDQDWTGWRFVTGAIPPDLELPLTVSYPLRLLSGDNTLHGSVWLGAVMALAGGVDFDVAAPVIERLSFSGGLIRAYVYDPDDDEHHCPASGIDRAELWIDGARRQASLEPEGPGFALHCAPEVCEGWHKAEIAAYDKAGNAGRKAAFFRSGAGVSWETPAHARLGNSFDITLTGMDAAYDELYLEWEFDGATQKLRVKPEQEKLALPVKAGYHRTGPAIASLRCRWAYYIKSGKAFPFCLPDLDVKLTAGLALTMRHCSRGFDAEFIVRRGNRPAPGARIHCNGALLAGTTDAAGLLTVPGLTDGELGETIEAFASFGQDFSYTKKVRLSRDFGQPLPVNITLTLRSSTEIGVTWQCGIAADAGFVQLDGEIAIAEWFPHYTIFHGVHTELSAFRAVLGGLEPGRRYRYRVGGPAGWSPAYEFRMPREGPALTFAVLADTHDSCGGAMASALLHPGLDFFLHAGDYVGSGNAYDHWLALHDDSRGLLPRSPLLPVVGNHDTMDGDGAHYRMIFASPRNGPAGCAMTYCCEIGGALFVALGDEMEPGLEQWLRGVCRDTKKAWKILFLHSGPYTCYLSSEAYEQTMSALARELGFDLVLSGHDHVYHRAAIDGVTYVQCGSSGGIPGGQNTHRPIWEKIHETARPMYSLVTVTKQKLRLQGIALAQGCPEGIVFDDIEIVK